MFQHRYQFWFQAASEIPSTWAVDSFYSAKIHAQKLCPFAVMTEDWWPFDLIWHPNSAVRSHWRDKDYEQGKPVTDARDGSVIGYVFRKRKAR